MHIILSWVALLQSQSQVKQSWGVHIGEYWYRHLDKHKFLFPVTSATVTPIRQLVVIQITRVTVKLFKFFSFSKIEKNHTLTNINQQTHKGK